MFCHVMSWWLELLWQEYLSTFQMLCHVMVIVAIIIIMLMVTLIKCLKGHKSLGSLCSVVKTLIVSGVRASKQARDRVTY